MSGSDLRDNHLQVPKLAGSDHLYDLARFGMMETGERLEDGHIVSFCSSLNFIHLGQVDFKRLLAQHVLAGLSGLYRPFAVERVGERVIYDIHLGVGQQVFIAPIRFGNAVCFGIGLGSLRIATGIGDQLTARRLPDRPDQRLIDSRRRQDSSSKPLNHCRCLDYRYSDQPS